MRMMGELSCKYGIHIEMSPFLENPVLSNLICLANASLNVDLPAFEHLPTDQQLEPFELNESQQALWIGRGSDFNYGVYILNGLPSIDCIDSLATSIINCHPKHWMAVYQQADRAHKPIMI